jgi:hypothetical protein
MNKFYVWLTLFFLIIAGHLIGGLYFGVFAFIWSLHHWFIFPALAFVFFLAAIRLGVILYNSEKLRSTIAYHNTVDYLRSCNFDILWFAATTCFEIGLFGTVVGSAFAMFTAFAAISGGGATLAAVATPLGVGMGTAMTATATGLVYAWLIKANLTMFFDAKESGQ